MSPVLVGCPAYIVNSNGSGVLSPDFSSIGPRTGDLLLGWLYSNENHGSDVLTCDSGGWTEEFSKAPTASFGHAKLFSKTWDISTDTMTGSSFSYGGNTWPSVFVKIIPSPGESATLLGDADSYNTPASTNVTCPTPTGHDVNGDMLIMMTCWYGAHGLDGWCDLSTQLGRSSLTNGIGGLTVQAEAVFDWTPSSLPDLVHTITGTHISLGLSCVVGDTTAVSTPQPCAKEANPYGHRSLANWPGRTVSTPRGITTGGGIGLFVGE
jgi:hypothetical protein